MDKSEETSDQETQYFFFLAECKNGESAIIGNPIPVSTAVAQLFLNPAQANVEKVSFAPEGIAIPSVHSIEPPAKNGLNNPSNPNVCPIRPIDPPALDTMNPTTIGNFMESLFKRATPVPALRSSSNSNEKREANGQFPGNLHVCNSSVNQSTKSASGTIRDFLPFRPSTTSICGGLCPEKIPGSLGCKDMKDVVGDVVDSGSESDSEEVSHDVYPDQEDKRKGSCAGDSQDFLVQEYSSDELEDDEEEKTPPKKKCPCKGRGKTRAQTNYYNGLGSMFAAGLNGQRNAKRKP